MSYEPVIDADGHVIESDADIFEYLPPPYRGEDQLFAYPFFPTLDGWHRAARRVTDKAGVRTERPDASDVRSELMHAIRADAELAKAKPESAEKPAPKSRLLPARCTTSRPTIMQRCN